MNSSASGQLNAEDLKRWGKNLLIFFSPVVLIYLISVVKALGALSGTGIDLNVFIPSFATQVAMLLYVFNSLIDLFRKVHAGPAITP